MGPSQVCLIVKILTIITLNTALVSSCSMKWFPSSESFVCVCNSANCESIDLGPVALADHLSIYTTDKADHRWAKSIIHQKDLVHGVNQLADILVSINLTDRGQTIFGFGGSFTDSAGLNINKLPNDLIDKLIDDYFHPINGIGYTFGRVPIAGSDFSTHSYSYDDVEDDFELKHFKLTDEDLKYKIPLIRKALNVSADLKLISAPWSPPKWLKTSNRYRGLGILKGDPGSICWKTFANYLVKFLQFYQQHGINFWGLSPTNEPSTGLMPKWPLNALGFSGYMMRDFIKSDLGPALAESGYGTDNLKLLIWDDQLLDMMPFIRVILNDKNASQYVSGVAYHWYSKRFYEYLDQVHEMYPNVFLLSTEGSEGVYQPVPVALGNWTRAENYATDIIEGLNRWSTGWIDWNLVLDESGGPNWVNNLIDALIIVNNTSPEYYKQPNYYVFGHFSKFIQPGSVHVRHRIVKGNDDNVKLTAFVLPSNDILVTILNKRDSPVRLSIDGLTEEPFTMTFKSRSITTLIKSA